MKRSPQVKSSSELRSADIDCEPLLNHGQLDLLRSVDEVGDEIILAEGLSIFLKESRSNLEALRENAAAGDRAAVARFAYTLAGSSSCVGFRWLNRICLELERFTEMDDAAPLERMSRDAPHAFQQSIEALGLGAGGPDAQ